MGADESQILPYKPFGKRNRDMNENLKSVSFAVITASDASSRGERADTSGEVITKMMRAAGHVFVEKLISPDDRALIAGHLSDWCDSGKADVIITTGGTGLGPRDVTPEATSDICDYEVPGIPEAFRAATVSITPFALLSRAKAAVRNRTLIINLPGNPKGVEETLPIVMPLLVHAVEILRGKHSKFHHSV